jgi:hypothetical protein
LSPPRANAADELGLPLPYSGVTAVTPSVGFSLYPSLYL